MKKKSPRFHFLPNSLTFINVSCGFFSLVSNYQGNFSLAAYFLFIAALVDCLDGFIARLMKVKSDFGIALDSTADVISFGVASSFLIYFWGFIQINPFGLGILLSLIYLVACVFRLARFNILKIMQDDGKFCTGLTTPASSLLLVSLVLYHPQPIGEKLYAFMLAILIIFLSLCMVSNLKYWNFLNLNSRKIFRLKTYILIAVLLGGFVLFTKISLISIFFMYALSGPLIHIFSFFEKKRQKRLKQNRAEACR